MMRVKPINLRLYRRFDADLIALNEHIPVNVVIEALLDAYAKGKRMRIIPEKCIPFNIGNRKGIHLTVTVRSEESSKLMAQIRPGFRNQFCKSILRDALVTDPLWVYFSDNEYTKRENERIHDIIHSEEVIVLPFGLRKKEYRSLLGVELERKKKEKREDYETEKKIEEKIEEKTDEKKEEKNEIRTEEKINTESEQFHFKPKLDLSEIEGWSEETETTSEKETATDDQDFYDAFESLFG
jgi:hypothetical protein